MESFHHPREGKSLPPGRAKGAARLITLVMVSGLAAWPGELPGGWSGDHSPCDRHQEVLKREHMNLGVRFSTADAGLAADFARAMDFWAAILDMEWHEEDSRDCSIQIVDGEPGLFPSAEVARAQFPGRPAFQGWIAFNPKKDLPRSERYLVAVHELGHLLGLAHNPSARSVMYYLCLEGAVLLDAADLAALAAHHRLRAGRPDKALIVAASGRPSGPDPRPHTESARYGLTYNPEPAIKTTTDRAPAR